MKTGKSKIFLQTVSGFTNHKFLWCLIACALFFSLCAFILPISYEENDDVSMIFFASGTYSGTPDPHLVFINIIYGYFLTELYSLKLGIEWYTVSFSIIHIISLSIISWKIFEKKDMSIYYKIAFLGLFLLLEVRFILYFQWTTTSGLGALAGLVLINCENKRQQFLGLVLFIVAGLIRFEAAILVLLIVSPIYLYHIFGQQRFYIFPKPIIFLTAGLAILSLCEYADYKAYRNDKNWDYYRQYNNIRGFINDNPNAWDLKKNIPSNVSPSDYALLISFFPDAGTFSLDKAKSIQTHLKQITIKEKLAHFIPAILSYKFYTILILTAGFSAFFGTRKRLTRWILALTFAAFFVACLYITLEGSLKYRVFFTALLPLLFVIFFSLENQGKKLFHRIVLIAITLFCLLLIRQNLGLWNLRLEARRTLFLQQKTLLDQYLSTPGNSVVPFAGDLTIQLYPAFGMSNSFTTGQLFFSSWIIHNPLNKKHFSSYRDLINKHGIFFKKDSYEYFIVVIEENIWENYGLKVQPQIEMATKDYLIVKLTL